MARDDKKRKKERKARNAALRNAGPVYEGEGRRRWQGNVSLQFGKDPRTRLDLDFSGIPIEVDVNDSDHMDGVAELTDMARDGNRTRN
jgi:hypothetical protein